MRAFHYWLETMVGRCDDASVSLIWRSDMRRTDDLDKDLATLDSQASAGPECDPERTPDFEQLFSPLVTESPLRAVGLAYVSEGSRLGGLVLRNSLLHSYPSLGVGGLSYLEGYGASTGQKWKAFQCCLNSLRLETPRTLEIVKGAVDGFRHIRQAFEALSAMRIKTTQEHQER